MKNKIIYFFIASLLVVAHLPVSYVRADAGIYITSVQITGGGGHTDEDFIELFNPNASAFNLKGHRLVKRTATATTDTLIKSWTTDIFVPAHSFYLWANTSFTTIAAAPDLTTSGTVSDNNGVAIRLGASDIGLIVDSLSWGNAANGFNNVSAANPGASQALVRIDVHAPISEYQLQDAAPRNFSITDVPPSPPPSANDPPGPGPDQPPPDEQSDPPTDQPPADDEPAPADPNAPTDPAPPPQETNVPADPPAPPGPVTKSALVKITELLPNPPGEDSGNEAVELQNLDNQRVNITGWFLDDKTETGSPQSSAYPLPEIILEPGQYISLIISHGQFALNNSGGDQLNLYYADEALADIVSYGDAEEGKSYQKIGESWVWGLPSLGTENVAVETPPEISVPAPSSNNGGGSGGGSQPPPVQNLTPPDWKLLITELFPNPNEDEEEFVELQNIGVEAINLKDIKVKIGSRSKTLPEHILEPNMFYVIEEDDLPARLRNTGNTISVEDKFKRKLSEITYPKSFKGQSFALSSSNQYLWTEQPTPGEINQIVLSAAAENQPAAAASEKKPSAAKPKTASTPKTKKSPKTATVAGLATDSAGEDLVAAETIEPLVDQSPAPKKSRPPYVYLVLAIAALTVLGAIWKFRERLF